MFKRFRLHLPRRDTGSAQADENFRTLERAFNALPTPVDITSIAPDPAVSPVYYDPATGVLYAWDNVSLAWDAIHTSA